MDEQSAASTKAADITAIKDPNEPFDLEELLSSAGPVVGPTALPPETALPPVSALQAWGYDAASDLSDSYASTEPGSPSFGAAAQGWARSGSQSSDDEARKDEMEDFAAAIAALPPLNTWHDTIEQDMLQHKFGEGQLMYQDTSRLPEKYKPRHAVSPQQDAAAADRGPGSGTVPVSEAGAAAASTVQLQRVFEAIAQGKHGVEDIAQLVQLSQERDVEGLSADAVRVPIPQVGLELVFEPPAKPADADWSDSSGEDVPASPARDFELSEEAAARVAALMGTGDDMHSD